MENKGLLFIPDISGFTKFVNETEIDHSRVIIEELLEVLINSNQLGLEISEIEGDAILFYKFGNPPEVIELYKQVEQMFCAFHRHLIAYDHNRFCQCTACMSAINLTLKVVTHYGEFTSYNVRNFRKLIGKDIIIAHQLLKNNIEQHEYWLVTNTIAPERPPEALQDWMEWKSSAKQTESGEVNFHYTHLSNLKTALKPEPYNTLKLEEKSKMFSITKLFDTDIITMFHGAGDFRYRHRWQEGVKEIREVSHFLPRVGTRCRCLLEEGEAFMYASSINYLPDKIKFSETYEKDESTRVFTLEKIDVFKTRLTIDFYIRKGIIRQLLFKLNDGRKLSKTFNNSFERLEQLVKEIQLPVQVDESCS